jgi:hypothetical protein
MAGRRTKIAPVLSALLDDLVDTAKLPGDHQVLRLARADLRALLAVARAAGEADILHDGPHEVGTAPKACAGCRLMRALSRASSWEGGGTR